MKRFVPAVFKHETNTFSPVPTPLEAFGRYASERGPIYGDDALKAYHGTNTPVGAFIDLAAEAAAELVFPLAADATPSAAAPDSVLDHCAMVLVHEGGWGRNGSAPAALDVFPDITSHSTENMGCLIAGGAGGLKGGVHVRAHRQHPVRVLNTALRAVGVNEELGEVKGTIDGLLG